MITNRVLELEQQQQQRLWRVPLLRFVVVCGRCWCVVSLLPQQQQRQQQFVDERERDVGLSRGALS